MKSDNSPKGKAIDLGLAISGALLPPGQRRDLPEIAAYAGCSKQMIHIIEQKALRKMKKALMQMEEQEDLE